MRLMNKQLLIWCMIYELIQAEGNLKGKQAQDQSKVFTCKKGELFTKD